MKKHLILTLSLTLIILFPIRAQQVSTVYEVYNFEVGDQFQISEMAPYIIRYYNIEILNRTYVPSQDFLMYERAVTTTTYNYEPNDTVYTSLVDTLVYNNLDGLVLLYVIDTVFSNPEMYNGRQVNRHDYSYPGWYTNYADYIVGCGGGAFNGGYWYYSGGGDHAEHNLTWYKKGDEEWGEEVIIVGLEEIKNECKDFNIFPNPASGDAVVIASNQHENGTAYIYDVSGNKIKSFIMKSGKTTFSISDFSPGIYLVFLESKNFKASKKLIVR